MPFQLREHSVHGVFMLKDADFVPCPCKADIQSPPVRVIGRPAAEDKESLVKLTAFGFMERAYGDAALFIRSGQTIFEAGLPEKLDEV